MSDLRTSVDQLKNELHEMSAISIELQALRSEICEMADLRTSVSQLKAQLHDLSKELQILKTDVREMANLRANEPVEPRDLVNTGKGASVGLVMMRPEVHDDVTQDSPPATSYASLAKDLKTASDKPFRATTKARRPPPICGKARTTALMAVEGMRRVDIFVSRFLPDVTEDDIASLVQDTFTSCSSIKVTRLQTRFDNYASFHVELHTSRTRFEDLVKSVYTDENWPVGILVRRFFRNNNHGGAQS